MKNKTSLDPRSHENPESGMVYEDTVYLKITPLKGKTKTVKWDAIEEVHAFKKDLFSVDLICLSFKKLGKEEYYEINEEMVGYHDLLENLPKRLENYDPKWFSAVAYPAFTPNHRVIWKRAAHNTKLAAPPAR